MDIKDVYKQRMTSDFVIRNIFDGQIPSANDISEYLKNLQLTDLPLVSNYTTEFVGPASAYDYDELLEMVGVDINSVWDFLHAIAKENDSLSNYTLGKLQSYEFRINDINRRANNLLLTSRDTEGFFDFFFDDFSTIENVDFATTTAFVDVDSTTARVPPSTRDDYVVIDPTKISFNILQGISVLSSGAVSGFDLSGLVDKTPRPWQHRVLLQEQVPLVEGVVTIEFDRLINGINRIEIDHASGTGFETVAFEYTIDGVNFLPFNTGTPEYTLSGNSIQVDVNLIDDIKAIRLVLRKRNHNYTDSSGRPVYIFALEEVRVFASGLVNSTSSAVLQSNPISFENKEITQVACEVCHSVPAGASIDYYIGTDIGGSTLFSPLSPSNSDDKRFTTIVDLTNKQNVKIIGSTYESRTEYDFNGKVQDSDILPVSYPLGTLIDKRYLYLWKNALSQSAYLNNSAVITDGTGWRTDGSTYSCVFFVDEPEGIRVDLKNTTAFVDNIEVTGQQFLTYGVHTFTTSASNWANAVEINNEPVDPIAPAGLNHKYLIEGVHGDSALAETWGYKSRPVIRSMAGIRCVYVPQVDFFNGDLNNSDGVMTIAQAQKDGSTQDVILTRRNKDNNGGNNTSLLVEYKSASQDDRSNNSIIFRAVLNASPDGAVPLLDDYLLKLGTVES